MNVKYAVGTALLFVTLMLAISGGLLYISDVQDGDTPETSYPGTDVPYYGYATATEIGIFLVIFQAITITASWIYLYDKNEETEREVFKIVP